MSMMRASGAMPTITALQMATASLATPKSLMKTMVGCGTGCPGTGSALLSGRNFEQALARKATASKDKAIRETTQGALGIIRSLRELAISFFSCASVFRPVDIRQVGVVNGTRVGAS